MYLGCFYLSITAFTGVVWWTCFFFSLIAVPILPSDAQQEDKV